MKVGDPSGRAKAREKKHENEIKRNLKTIRRQYHNLWDHARQTLKRFELNDWHDKRPEFLDNSDWYHDAKFLDVLSALGPGMRLGAMLGRDS